MQTILQITILIASFILSDVWAATWCTTDSDCSGRGKCKAGLCHCMNGWGDMQCTNSLSTKVICSSNGNYYNCKHGSTCCSIVMGFGKQCCGCSNGGYDQYCDIPVFTTCSPACSNGGTCFPSDTCTCTAQWTGSRCTIPVCSPVCLNGGTCTAPNVCTCAAGWTSSTCATPVCSNPSCQNGGTCTAPNTCSCTSQWSGANCTTPVCVSVCENGGSCTAPNVCTCTTQWTGGICTTPVCPGGCLNGGSCTAPDTCSCMPQWSGWNCTTPVCTQTCSNGGSCTAPDTCTCTSQWSGSNCTTPICPGGCSNGGSCTAPGVCTCATGWAGTNCETPVCTTPCQVGTNCIAPDVCSCLPGWTGWITCDTPICTQICSNGGTCAAPDTCNCTAQWSGPNCTTPVCPGGCLNGGSCAAPGLCSCTAGWASSSTNCDTPTCVQTCANGGSCTAPDTCTCTSQWSGANCTTPVCPGGCLNGGSCALPGECSCAAGWSNSTTNCATPICTAPCLNGGLCTAPNTCTCTSVWSGPSCAFPVCPGGCYNGGSCTAPGLCTCATGWTGPNCTSAICGSPCLNGGSCTAPNICTCSTGWTSANCSVPICATACSNGGTCSAPNICTCTTQWTGATCQLPVCPAGCLHGGSCSAPGYCSCTPGWTSANCGTAICTNGCLNGGSCTAPNTCTCTLLWSGGNCSTPVCTGGCQNGASCNAPNVCTCTSQWSGATCTIPVCNSPCQNGGSCTAPNTCTCTSDWAGLTCTNPVCQNACLNGGSCTAPNTCTCPNGWSGALCDIPVCTSQCLNGGSCTLPDTCTCSNGWSGATCSTPLCTNPSCLNGVCVAPNNCSCSVGWTSSNCGTPVCTPLCSFGGTCTAPNSCTCSSQWTGATCSEAVCNPTCKNGGFCALPNFCSCNNGWSGSECTIPLCIPSCTNGGSCTAPFTCTCQPGWTGHRCQNAICSPSCQNGLCSSPGVCTCQPGWTGDQCQTPICSPNCDNGGVCIAPNTCICPPDWTDSTCQTPFCYPKCHTTGGVCTVQNKCNCHLGWTDERCSTAICSPSCNSKGGNCTAPDVCSCFSGWVGGRCEIPNCTQQCKNGGLCISPNTCQCQSPWTGSACESLVANTPITSIYQFSAQSVAENIKPIEQHMFQLAQSVSANILNDTGAAVKEFQAMSELLDRFRNDTAMSPAVFSTLTKAVSAAADDILAAATNATEGEEQVFFDEGSLKCFVSEDGAIGSKITKPYNFPGLAKEKLKVLFNSFLEMLGGMFRNLRQELQQDMTMTFTGRFYAAVVMNLPIAELSGLKIDTNLANVEFPMVSDPLKLFNSTPTGCQALERTSTVALVLSAFIVNVMNVYQPFNMPTIAVRMYCSPTTELVLNLDEPVLIVAKPSNPKARMFSNTKVDAQCDVSKVRCTSENVQNIGSFAKFPLTKNAGDFILIFPVIELDYSAYILFDDRASQDSYTWSLNVSADSFSLSRNESLDAPRGFYNAKEDLRIIISEKMINQYMVIADKPDWHSPVLHVYMKRDLSRYITEVSTKGQTKDLPPSACQLQRAYGYHLRIKRVVPDKQSNRVRRETESESDDGFELLPQSNESTVVFKSSYFGDFGADLVVSPNTIEFAYIFENFAELLQDNMAVMIFQACAIVFFLVAVFFAYKFDKIDLREWAFLPLVGNKKYQDYSYFVTVHYSKVRHFELEPRIHIRLLGNIYDSPWRLLRDGVRTNFKGKHPENFILNVSSPIGRLDAIELLVDSSNKPLETKQQFSLYVDRIVVIDAQKAHKYVFVVKSDCKVGDPVLYAEMATENDLKSYKYLISGHSRTGATDVHPWLSIAQRPLPSNWTRVERLACVVSALFMSMMVNAMFYGRESASPQVGLKVGTFFTISWFTLWTSFVAAVIVIPPTAVIAIFFKKVERKSAVRSPYLTSLKMKLPKAEPPNGVVIDENAFEERKPFKLPFFCIFIAWILVAACISVSAFICIMYSLQWGREKSVSWLTGMILNVTQDIILIQPIKVVITAIFNATLHSIPNDGSDGIGYLVFNKRTNRRDIELFKKLRALIVSISHHVIYVLITAITIATLTNPFAYKQINVLQQYTKDLKEIADPIRGTILDFSQVFDWVDKALHPNLLTGNQLEFGGRFKTSKQLYNVTNPNIVLLGPLRLRQQRVANQTCPLSTSIIKSQAERFQNLTYELSPCQRPYSDFLNAGDSSEQRSFNQSWLEPFQHHLGNFSTQEAPWLYRSTGGQVYSGWEAQRETGGYYVDLPRTLNQAREIIRSLKAKRWLDNATSVLFIDFNVFNMQTNLFVPIKIVFEALSAGGLTYHVRMFPLQLYQYSGASSMLVFAVQGLWVLLLFSHLFRIIRSIVKGKRFLEFFKNDHWNILDASQILLGLVILSLFCFRIYTIMGTVTQIQTMRSSHINLDLLVSWEALMFNLYGLLFFLILMLFFRYLTFNKYWAIATASLSKGKEALATYCALFMGCLIAFAALAFMIMGSQSWNFSSFSRSVLNLTQGLIGIVDFTSVRLSTFHLFLVMMFTAVVLFLGGNMFVTLIMASYSDVVVDVTSETSWDVDLSEYLSKQVDEISKHLVTGKENLRKTRPATEDAIFSSVDDCEPIGEKDFAELERRLHRISKIVERSHDNLVDGTDVDDKMSWSALVIAHEVLMKMKFERHAARTKKSSQVPFQPVEETNVLNSEKPAAVSEKACYEEISDNDAAIVSEVQVQRSNVRSQYGTNKEMMDEQPYAEITQRLAYGERRKTSAVGSANEARIRYDYLI